MYSNHPKLAKEFEAATPEGKKLPEHVAKMADGGEVEENSIAKMIDDLHNKYIRSQGDNGNLKGLQNVASSSSTVKNPNERKGMKEEAGNYADGGDVQPQPFGVGGQSGDGRSNLAALLALIKSAGTAPAVPGMQGSLTQNLASSIGQGVTAPGTAGIINDNLGTNLQDSGSPQPVNMSSVPAPEQPMSMSSAPPQEQPPTPPQLSDTASALNKTPDTNYDFYGNVGADKRAALYKQLLDQQRSPGNLIAQGLGGVGDALSALGGKSTDFQGQARDIAAKNTENRIGAVDTQRQQKTQDMNANIEMQMNDPNSRIAKSMQATLKSAGLNVPGGMPPSVMLKVAGPLGELAMKQATIAEMSQYHKAEIGQKQNELATREDIFKSEHPILNYLNPVGGESPSSPVSNPNAPHGVPELGSHFNGGKVLSVKRIK
jgi:hypothetical protein